MKHIKYFIVLLFAFGLASCATTNSIDYEDMSSKIQSGEMGGVIGSFNSTGLTRAILQVENLDDKSNSTVVFAREPRVYNLTPGTYRIKSGRVSGYNVTGNMPAIGLWAENFEVNTGEIVDLGQLNMNQITIDVKTSAGTKVLNALNSFGTNINNDRTYVGYTTEPMSYSPKTDALEKFPNIENVTARLLKVRLSETEYRQAILEASAKGPDGKLPSHQDVKQKLSKSLLMMFLKSNGLGTSLAPTK